MRALQALEEIRLKAFEDADNPAETEGVVCRAFMTKKRVERSAHRALECLSLGSDGRVLGHRRGDGSRQSHQERDQAV
jgi:hypothetical protein